MVILYRLFFIFLLVLWMYFGFIKELKISSTSEERVKLFMGLCSGLVIGYCIFMLAISFKPC